MQQSTKVELIINLNVAKALGLTVPQLLLVYLHYVFDLWAERWRRREATRADEIVE